MLLSLTSLIVSWECVVGQNMNHLTKRFLSIFFIIFFGCAGVVKTSVFAESKNEKIVIVVGGVVITSHDVDDRLSFMLVSMGMPNTPENRDKMRKEATKSLVHEALQLQEIKRHAEINEKEVDMALADMAQRANIPVEKFSEFLGQHGVSVDTVRQFISVQKYWPLYIQSRYSNIMNIDPKKIEAIKEEQKASKGKVRLLLSEIFIPINTPSEEKLAKEQIIQVHQQASKENFESLAQSFSKAPSAMRGGNLDWMPEDLLPEESQKALKITSVGRFTQPIRIEDGYVVYFVKNKQLPGEPMLEDTVFALRQMIIPHNESLAEVAVEELKQAKCSEDLDQVFQKYSFIHVEKSDSVSAQQLNPVLLEYLSKLEDNKLSQPYTYPTGIMYMWVCSRKNASTEMTEGEIRHRLVMQNLMHKSRSVIQGLLRATYVEVKDPESAIN